MSTKKVGAAGIIVNEQGHILLVKHSYGKYNWEIPGGLSEPFESAEQTVIREIAEETGLIASVEKLTGVYYEEKHDMHHFVFICQVDQSQIASADQQEVTQCAYFDINDLPRPISDFTIIRIQDAINSPNKPSFRTVGNRVWYE